jgi:hypothetical protein
MRMRPDPHFVHQFQWEVDRWVFRYRQKGAPVQVSKAEAEMLIRQHARRHAIFGQIVVLSVIGAAVLCAAFPKSAWMIFPTCAAALFVGLPRYQKWAYADVTRHLQERAPIGMKLDFNGQLMRRIEALSWRDLVVALVWFALMGGPTLARAGTRLSDLPLVLIDMAVLTVLLVVIVIKWGQRERRRVHERITEEMRRAREWR